MACSAFEWDKPFVIITNLLMNQSVSRLAVIIAVMASLLFSIPAEAQKRKSRSLQKARTTKVVKKAPAIPTKNIKRYGKSFSDIDAIVLKDTVTNLYGCEYNGRLFLPVEYPFVSVSRYGCFVGKGERLDITSCEQGAFIDFSGKTIVDFDEGFNYVQVFDYDGTPYIDVMKWIDGVRCAGIMDMNRKMIIDFSNRFEYIFPQLSIGDFKSFVGQRWKELGGCSAAYDANGKVLIPLSDGLSSIGINPFGKDKTRGFFSVSKDGKEGARDLNGRTVCYCRYESIFADENGQFVDILNHKKIDVDLSLYKFSSGGSGNAMASATNAPATQSAPVQSGSAPAVDYLDILRQYGSVYDNSIKSQVIGSEKRDRDARTSDYSFVYANGWNVFISVTPCWMCIDGVNGFGQRCATCSGTGKKGIVFANNEKAGLAMDGNGNPYPVSGGAPAGAAGDSYSGGSTTHSAGVSAGSKSHGRVCPSCGGRMICTSCNGKLGEWRDTGYYNGGGSKTWFPCPTCHGSGKCFNCHGRGKID